jgi:hypothetical protein
LVTDPLRERGFAGQADRLEEIVEQAAAAGSLDEIVKFAAAWQEQLKAFILSGELEIPEAQLAR